MLIQSNLSRTSKFIQYKLLFKFCLFSMNQIQMDSYGVLNLISILSSLVHLLTLKTSVQPTTIEGTKKKHKPEVWQKIRVEGTIRLSNVQENNEIFSIKAYLQNTICLHYKNVFQSNFFISYTSHKKSAIISISNNLLSKHTKKL